jgi:hypothetical protein
MTTVACWLHLPVFAGAIILCQNCTRINRCATSLCHSHILKRSERGHRGGGLRKRYRVVCMFKLIQSFSVRCWRSLSPVKSVTVPFVTGPLGVPAAKPAQAFPLLHAFQAAVLAAPVAEQAAKTDGDDIVLSLTLAYVTAAAGAAAPVAPVSVRTPTRKSHAILSAQLRSVSNRNTPLARKLRTAATGTKSAKSAGASKSSPLLGVSSTARRSRTIGGRYRPDTKLAITKRSPRRRHVWLTGTAASARPTAAILRFQTRPTAARTTARPQRLAA